jgi:uncharacterized coiled-coil protein SlyX
MTEEHDDGDRIDELEIKLVYQEKLIHELDALVRTFGTRLDDALRELRELKKGIASPEIPLGGPNEKPPHY